MDRFDALMREIYEASRSGAFRFEQHRRTLTLAELSSLLSWTET